MDFSYILHSNELLDAFPFKWSFGDEDGLSVVIGPDCSTLKDRRGNSSRTQY